MKYVNDLSDSRLRTGCIHCDSNYFQIEASITPSNLTKDHVPSKCLLMRPYPTNLPVVDVCHGCNQSYSADEEYFAAFLRSVISGSTDPKRQNPQFAAKKILKRSAKLRDRIDQSNYQGVTLLGESFNSWFPEIERFKRVVIKNARGHFVHEFGNLEPASSSPSHEFVVPIDSFEDCASQEFENCNFGGISGWPEIGSRMMFRLTEGYDLDGLWVVVQDGVYRYAVDESGVVRTVITNIWQQKSLGMKWPDF